MTSARGSVRRHVRIRRPADSVWDRIGDPARVHEWFRGIEAATVEGTTRVITTGAGIPMPEEIVTHDPVQRRFQYRITAPMFREHLSTLDVLDLDDGSCVVVYAADAEPSLLALLVAGAAGSALEHLRDEMEGTASPPAGGRTAPDGGTR